MLWPKGNSARAFDVKQSPFSRIESLVSHEDKVQHLSDFIGANPGDKLVVMTAEEFAEYEQWRTWFTSCVAQDCSMFPSNLTEMSAAIVVDNRVVTLLLVGEMNDEGEFRPTRPVRFF